MQSVIVSDFGVTLGRTSERLVVRGPRPQFELIEGGPQLLLPFDLPSARPELRLVTSEGVQAPAVLERLESEVVLRGQRQRLKSAVQAQARRAGEFFRGETAYRPFAFKW